jgi:hypothetical protein
MDTLTLVSPAPTCHPEFTWEKDFVARATVKDVDGFPLEGMFGHCFQVRKDITSFPEDEEVRLSRMVNHITVRCAQKKIECSPKSALRDATQLLGAHSLYKKGYIMAFKKGTRPVAIIQLTTDYVFCPDQEFAWHSWGYRVLKRVELPSCRGWRRTVMPNQLKLPVWLHREISLRAQAEAEEPVPNYRPLQILALLVLLLMRPAQSPALPMISDTAWA